MCSDVLPFSLIPVQLEELKNEINLDQQKIKNSHEKDILNKNFQEIQNKIKSSSFLSKYDEKIKNNLTAEMQKLFTEIKLDSISETQKLSYNLSQSKIWIKSHIS